MTSEITMTEIEAAINYWRHKEPAQGEELRLSRKASVLAEPYAMMIMTKRKAVAMELLSAAVQEVIRQWRSETGQS